MPNFESPSFWETSLTPVLLASIPLIILLILSIVLPTVSKQNARKGNSKEAELTYSEFWGIAFSIFFIFPTVAVILVPALVGAISYQEGQKQAIVSQTKDFLNEKYEIDLDNKTVEKLSGAKMTESAQVVDRLTPEQFDPNSSNYTPHQKYGEVESYAEKSFSTLRLVRDGDVLTLLEQKDDSAKEVTLRGK